MVCEMEKHSKSAGLDGAERKDKSCASIYSVEITHHTPLYLKTRKSGGRRPIIAQGRIILLGMREQ